jgi:hypothetical protein
MNNLLLHPGNSRWRRRLRQAGWMSWRAVFWSLHALRRQTAGNYVLTDGGVTGMATVVTFFVGIEATTMTATASNK